MKQSITQRISAFFRSVPPRLRTLSDREHRTKLWRSTPVVAAFNLLIVYALYEVCRLVFLWVNRDLYADTLTWSVFRSCLRGGWRFDSSAIFYTNSLYLLLVFLPLHVKERGWYRSMTKWIFVTVNSLCMLANLADTVFFEFRLHRTTMAVFQEFSNESNFSAILWPELVSHWYLTVLLAGMVWVLIRCFRQPGEPRRPLWRYYVKQTIWLAIVGLTAVCAMRGNIFFLSATRPISINYAFRYVEQPVYTGLVLNTPFSIIRTIGQTTMPTPHYFSSQAELDAVYNPVHEPSDSATVRNKNVVILIVESFAREFIGGLNKDLDGGTYKGYTPYTDAMLDSCMYFDTMIANTFFSIDAPPAVLASIPRADRPFVTSPHAVNHINSIASELRNRGYSTAFFHGADNESLGFSAFTRQAGFEQYYGQDEFYADARFGGKAEFDGTWGVWDEPFLQFFCAKLSEMPQPFVGAVFTLSSHHPFRVPDKYSDRFTDEGRHELHKCIKYADFAIHEFFESARKQPWFSNTIFVIVADHTSSKRTHAEYKAHMGDFYIPILFYDPSGELPRGRQKGIAQQIDIMPTLLNYLGYDQPYVAFGKDLLNTPPEETWAFNWNDLPTYIKGDYILTFDGEQVISLYNFRTDPLLTENLKGRGLPEEEDMTLHVKAVLQSYLSRMNEDNATVK